jgi:hypothetical protein
LKSAPEPFRGKEKRPDWNILLNGLDPLVWEEEKKERAIKECEDDEDFLHYRRSFLFP